MSFLTVGDINKLFLRPAGQNLTFKLKIRKLSPQ